MSDEQITVEQIETFYRFLLTGEVPEGYFYDAPNRKVAKGLSARHAWHIIYYLQENLKVLPSAYEICNGCGDFFNSDAEGFCEIDELAGHVACWCEDCIPLRLFAPPSMRRFNFGSRRKR